VQIFAGPVRLAELAERAAEGLSLLGYLTLIRSTLLSKRVRAQHRFRPPPPSACAAMTGENRG
jgi:hypothetical protein